MTAKTKINNRRYLGNKYRILPFILEVTNSHCIDINSVADIFCGTGAVSSLFKDKQLIANDLLYSNYLNSVAWFLKDDFSQDKVDGLIDEYNSSLVSEENYMTENFAGTFFSKEVCSKIGYVRDNIEQLFQKGELTFKERAILVISLIYAIDKIAATCGHYDAYRKNVELPKDFTMRYLDLDYEVCEKNECFNKDANVVAKEIQADLVYLDPPYNSRQYSDAYHLLENIAAWKKPNVRGVAKKMDRSTIKSDYCTEKATSAFNELIEHIDARYILLSYNNMAAKGASRSNAKISDEDIMQILRTRGNVQVFSHDLQAFNAGKTSIIGNQERLFLVDVK